MRVKLGKAFPDSFLPTTKSKLKYCSINSDFGERKPLAFFIFYAILFLLPLAFAGRLFYLQVIEGKYYETLALKNRIWEKTLSAPRGAIFDRNKVVIARNVPLYRKKLDNFHYQIITRDEALNIEVAQNREDSVSVIPGRQYPYPDIFAHVIGYVAEASKKDLQSGDYKPGDFIGVSGLEKEQESKLRGIDGKEIIEVDAKGRELRVLGKVPPKAGSDIFTSLDFPLSQAAYEAFNKASEDERYQGEKTLKGAVIVSDPRTGEILSLLSFPSYDANVFVNYFPTDRGKSETLISNKSILNYLNDPALPLFNRAIGGAYPPGSTFKIVTATAGLESGKINKETLIEDTGVITIGRFQFPNWLFLKKGEKDGFINILTAIQRSNDVFFYRVGERVGLSEMEKWAKKMGVSERLGIDIPGEASGIFPTNDWKKRTVGEEWYLGDTYHLAIGQGYLLVTPLQVNSWTNIIANGGYLCKPHIVLAAGSADKNYCRSVGIKAENVALIKEGMKRACKEGGTSWPLFGFSVKSSRSNKPMDISLACKTGTAEFGDPLKRTHAWFTVFAPADKPEISITVLIEGGGEGSDVAAPVAKKILEEWFKR